MVGPTIMETGLKRTREKGAEKKGTDKGGRMQQKALQSAGSQSLLVSCQSETQAMLDDKVKAYDEYLEKLRTEFKYTKKEIANDPDAQDMKAEITKLQGGK